MRVADPRWLSEIQRRACDFGDLSRGDERLVNGRVAGREKLQLVAADFASVVAREIEVSMIR